MPNGLQFTPAFPLKSPESYHFASNFYKIIAEEIKDFQDSLDDEHEICLQLASFGQSVLMAVEDIGYHNPSTLFFYGTVDGQPATLIQHVNQLNFLVMSVEKPDPSKAPRRIGFELPTEDPSDP